MFRRLSVDSNNYLDNPAQLIIPTSKIKELELKEDMDVIAFEDNAEWEGRVYRDELKNIWYVEIHEETYRDLSFPMKDMPSFEKMNKAETLHNLKAFKREARKRLYRFSKHYMVDNNDEQLLLNEDSLHKVSVWVVRLSDLILGEDKRVFFEELNNISKINNPEQWYQQAVGCNIKNVNPGFIELMLDISIYYGTYLTTNYYSTWKVGKNNSPVIKIFSLKKQPVTSDIKIKDIKIRNINLQRIQPLVYHNLTLDDEIEESLFVNPFQTVAEFVRDFINEDFSLYKMHINVIDKVTHNINNEKYR